MLNNNNCFLDGEIMMFIEIDCSWGLLVEETSLCYVTAGHAKSLSQYSVAKIMKLFSKVLKNYCMV